MRRFCQRSHHAQVTSVKATAKQCQTHTDQDFAFDKIEVEDQERVDDMAGIYNDAAISGDFHGATLDMYGNPVGGDFDLARDGAFEGFKMLVLCAYHQEGLPQDLQSLTIPELSKKGFNVKVCMSVDEPTRELRQGSYHVAWILSSTEFVGDKEAFLTEVQKFHRAGRGLMIWGDNHPYFAHANLVLERLFGFKLEGNTPGGKELRPGNPLQAGCFGEFPTICAGILKLHEGITACRRTGRSLAHPQT
ncbi:unnamed protein product [Effrenium voratum]|uniref:Uncharacterized protein n=1 Tax=Effrenium voratum TaxID=2562239 RepID=A0AA36J4N1_9DINO|nr:unnamed protein product [Effrenium voratum]CAJ1449203.1 unnamed protein product [Effrenium voratum]